MVLAVAEKLKKFPHEVEESMGDEDLLEFDAYWTMQNEERDRAAKKARRSR